MKEFSNQNNIQGYTPNQMGPNEYPAPKDEVFHEKIYRYEL